MTYGVLPPRAEFKKAFDEEMAGKSYTVRNDSILGDVDFDDASDLYRTLASLVKAMEKGSDESGDLASAILSTLGFEWV
jgi:hypothetical protein